MDGRPLEAERAFSRAISISRDNEGEQTVSPMLLVNYSRALSDLNRLKEAADYSGRGYAKAVKRMEGARPCQVGVTRAAARSAAEQLEHALGPDHPDTRAAQQLALNAPSK